MLHTFEIYTVFRPYKGYNVTQTVHDNCTIIIGDTITHTVFDLHRIYIEHIAPHIYHVCDNIIKI